MTDTERSELEAPPVLVSEPESPKDPVRKDPVRRAGWFAPVLGGVIAAGIGYGLAQYVPGGWPIQDTSALQAALAAQQAETEGLKAQVAELAARPVAGPDSDLEARVAALADQAAPDLAPLQQQIAALEQRLAAVEATPPAGGAPSAAALAAQKAAADEVLKQAEATAAQIKADAEATAKAAEARAALGRVQAALDSGAAYASALPALGEVPAVLAENAETGLPTIAALQDAFPAASRAALEAALRANMGENWSDRVSNFLRTQTGARSLTPREGSDPDAILSRAEAALTAGDVAAALKEIAALPPEAQAALADWQAMAQKRQEAVAAVAALATAMQ
ncbi:COG4223 family protein [Cypionkella sinensis]|uniref:COG4223 family protein n=1 Tax=Cypionkella sinensis TaxID=1756043 RepID=A0ABV7J0J8_9RHOB